MSSILEVTLQTVETAGHTTSYLACGPEDGPLVVFVHGWPELSISWRHQLPVLGALGFRAVAPGHAGLRPLVASTRDHGRLRAGADRGRHAGPARTRWAGSGPCGSATTGAARWCGTSPATTPSAALAVANLCVPYGTLERQLGGDDRALVDRDVYPEDRFPVGQWDYQLFYQENFERATAVMDANPSNRAQGAVPQGQPGAASASRR